MDLPDLTRRVRRLDELSRGLFLEVVLVARDGDPLLRAEQRAYVDALRNTLAAVERARLTLEGAANRLKHS